VEDSVVDARLMIVEDDPIEAEDLRRSLEASGYDVVGRASSAREAVELARTLRPDLVLLDLPIDGVTDGIEAARAIAGSADAALVCLSVRADEAVVSEAAHAGALAFIVKPWQPPQITSSVAVALSRYEEVRALRDRRLASPLHSPFGDVLHRLQALAADDVLWTTLRRADTGAAVPVTRRERDVVRGLVCYRRLARVADVLGISIHTARNHLKSVLRKLGLHSQDELLQLLLEGAGRPAHS
jgi:DNA-binding NarL/FixJ family response regulator